jgi:hypothetical protein
MPYDPTMSRRVLLTFAVILLLVGACDSQDEGEGVDQVAPPTRLVLWNEDEIAVLEDEAITELGATGAVSQVTASHGGGLVWTSLETAPPTVKATIDTGERIELDTTTVPFFYSWNPTGSHIAFLGNSASGTGLVFGLIDVDAGEVTPIETPAPFFFDWSPDGDRLIAHIGGTSLAIIDADTGEAEDLGLESGPFPAPIWTDAGIVVVTRLGPTVGAGMRSVAYQQARSEIVLVDPVTRAQTELASVDGPVRLFAGNARLAVVAGQVGSQTIEVLDRNGGTLATLGSGTIDLAQWSPDGATLLWTERAEDRTLTPKAWSGGEPVEFDEFTPTRVFATAYLPFWDQYDRAISLWAPDSGSFALPIETASGPAIDVYDLAGGTSSYPDWDMAIWHPAGN